eukprot:TRINITY_DN7350_c0_g6_i1.p1 TRINITY_DN7350_c0_g6~~TRINITY_DN7350_c0_g6_i1.p1  ORF type:complete len:782 (-),score=96.02 TRINITY_DN7350_c0_g6_i1:86-2431(-)
MGVLWNFATAGIAVASAYDAFLPTSEPNMNGEYLLSQTPGGIRTQEKFPKQYRDYPGGVQYFDIYSPPIKTLYSQVFWTGLTPVDLPEDVVKRYAGGKAMAVVGFEIDQVRRTADGDVSVPINVAYNHHFESNMVGAKAEFEKITLTGPDDPRIHEFNMHDSGHCHSPDFRAGSEHWIVKPRGKVVAGAVPFQQAFGAANGGETRKSFHGYAPGFAQVIESPEQLQITPMQIDTWHREKMNLTGSKFVAGPLPRSSLAPPGAEYSGLLECPLTTRVTKDVEGGYDLSASKPCEHSIKTGGECFGAVAKQLKASQRGLLVYNKTVTDSSHPVGCSVEADSTGRTVTVTFNENLQSSGHCGAGSLTHTGFTESLVTVNVSLDPTKDEAKITLTGPSSVWFGVGFNAQQMKDAPWAVIVDGHGRVSERKLADQNPGSELPASVVVVSSAVIGDKRSVVLTRSLRGRTSQYYTFSVDQVAVPFINAIGNGPDLAYHKIKTASSLTFLPVGGTSSSNGACVCVKDPAPFGQAKGTLNYQPTKQRGETGQPVSIGFANSCAPAPRTDLLEQKNPTCDVRTYAGGQIACHHMFSLLDADQDIPWPDQPLEYSLKFRFWYQDYNESYHAQVERTTWGIASPVEYDVPKCNDNIPGCSRGPDGRWIHTITGTYTGQGSLVAAHFHCHAPTCVSMQMYRNWNGTHGELICEERPVYGQGSADKFDEKGYILQPPCLWGAREFGLEPPPNVEHEVLHTIKTAYADSGHHGEMAWQQMLYLPSKAPSVKEFFV